MATALSVEHTAAQVDTWSEADLVAQVLAGPEPAVEVLELAHQLERLPFWQRRALGVAGLVKEHGVPHRYARRLVALWTLAERWFPDDRPVLTSPEQALVLFSWLRESPVERVALLTLDNRYHVTGIETVVVGGLNVARLRIRDVLAPAMRNDAAAIVLAHNHPGGSPRPSQADRRLTAALREATDLVGIELLDHLVVTRHRHYSFRQEEQWHSHASWLSETSDGY